MNLVYLLVMAVVPWEGLELVMEAGPVTVSQCWYMASLMNGQAEDQSKPFKLLIVCGERRKDLLILVDEDTMNNKTPERK